MLASTSAFTIFCVVVTYHVFQSVLLSQRAAQHVEHQLTSNDVEARKTLSFEVCNGMANQRLSLLYGVILAYELGRTAVLPDFMLSGVQWSAENKVAAGSSDASSTPMSAMYDVDAFMHAMTSMGVEVADAAVAPPKDQLTTVDISKMEDPVEELGKHKDTAHLAVGCPLFKLPSIHFGGANNRIMWAALEGIRPNKHNSKTIKYIIKQLRGMSPHKVGGCGCMHVCVCV